MNYKQRPGNDVIKKFKLGLSEHNNATAHETKILKNVGLVSEIISSVEFILLINVKIPTTVDILTFMSRINFVLS